MAALKFEVFVNALTSVNQQDNRTSQSNDDSKLKLINTIWYLLLVLCITADLGYVFPKESSMATYFQVSQVVTVIILGSYQLTIFTIAIHSIWSNIRKQD